MGVLFKLAALCAFIWAADEIATAMRFQALLCGH
jgi:hypothetical protein